MRSSLWRFGVMLAAVAALAAPAWAIPPTGGTGPGGFDVLNGTSALRVWLKADAIPGVISGNQFAIWNDSSPYNYHVTDGTAPRAEFHSNVFNTATPQPGVRFNNASQSPGVFSAGSFNTLFIPNGNNATMFTAYQNAAFPANDHLGLTTTGPAGSEVDLFDQGFFASYNGDFRANRLPGQNLGYPDFGQTIKTVVSSQAANSWQLFADGQLKSLPTAQDWAVVSNFQVGTSNHGASSFGGDIGEIIVFNTALNSAQRQIVENYLSAKYDMSLDAGDVYTGDTAANGHHDRDVFGIGRVNASNQSLSAGAAGLGIEAINNSLGDGEFVLAGHKVTTNSLVLTGSFEHSNRTFFVDATTTNGVDVSMLFDFSDLGLTAPPPGSALHLLFDPAGGPVGFTSLATGVLSGDQVSFNVSNIQDGLFTVGLLLPEPSGVAIWLLMGGAGVGCVWLRRRKSH